MPADASTSLLGGQPPRPWRWHKRATGSVVMLMGLVGVILLGLAVLSPGISLLLPTLASRGKAVLYTGVGARWHHDWRKVAALTPLGVPDQCRVVLNVIRHCEKPQSLRSDNGHCSAKGYERVEFIRQAWGRDGGRYATPDVMVARAPTGHHHVFREVETLGPLADDVGVALNVTNHHTRPAGLAIGKAITGGANCDKELLVCWKHNKIPKLLRMLGCTSELGCPEDWRGHDFDTVVRVEYTLWRRGLSQHLWHINGTIGRMGFGRVGDTTV